VNKSARLFFLSLFMTTVAANAAQRTFVSAGSGIDANPCSRPSPCRSFGVAIAQTDAGGEVIVLDSGGYGAVTITQSVSIISPLGVYAGISGFTGAAIEVNAPSGYVSLHGLFLNGQGGATGVAVTAANATHIENLLVTGFTGNGIEIDGGSAVFVKDSIVRNCGLSGILVAPLSGSTVLSVDGARLEYDGYGLAADSGVRLTVRNTVVAYSNQYGIWFRSSGSLPALHATVENVTVTDTLSFQKAAFAAEAGAHVTIRNSAAVRSIGNGFSVAESTLGTEMVVDGCLASEHNYNGFLAGAAGGSGTALLTISNSVASNNGSNGIVAGTNGTVRAFSNISTRNSYGLNGQNGTFESFGNNAVKGNYTMETLGPITSVPTM